MNRWHNHGGHVSEHRHRLRRLLPELPRRWVWLWFDPERRSGPVQALLADPATPVLLRAANVWELILKHHRGKLPELEPAIGDLPGLLDTDGFHPLPIALAHALRAGACHQPPRSVQLHAPGTLRVHRFRDGPAVSRSRPCEGRW